MKKGTSKVDTTRLKRTKPDVDEEVEEREVKVSAGSIDKVIDLAFNPTRDKIREVTIIDRVQGRLFPQLDMINYLRHYCLEIAQYRQSPEDYKTLYKKPMPVPPEPLDEFLFRTAQWQKSVAGKNLEKITDIALAETEGRAGEDEQELERADAWKE